jgi:RimJ/RimL family protein N-acetyltransferase
LLTADVHIERFDPGTDQQRLRSCFDIRAAARPYDDPSLPPQSFAAFAARWTHGSGDPLQAWLASDDSGEPAGCYVLMLPERENPTMAWCALTIAPARRRSGFGTELIAHCAAGADCWPVPVDR